ncbi:MAG: hypothetical protein B5M56_00435 [Desulfococcus sp. 4484_241]|nr:MAG: hypothetical protein B5M56_00435 [Desulfococcus sp. 4484_241]RLC30169.1 MAG: hypothetical protein DRH32_06165 [Deltaproteobacteria bacterium]
MKKILPGKTAVIALAIIMVVAAVSQDPAWGDNGNGDDPSLAPAEAGGPPPPYMAQAKITPEQKKQLEALFQKYIDETVDISADLKAKTYKLGVLVMAPQTEESRIKSLAKDIAELKAKLFLKRVDYMLKAKKIAPHSRFLMMLLRGNNGPRNGPAGHYKRERH